ncbi:hypothetical protein DF185_06930 [Marinifilum breve]|uniref:Uncharacterized protein n=1 Tax=Marinifilum breve TaxID=2184082 RepID=A0A2V4A0H0_9BACT|nr:hypothetical protein [Marinifilum breve]PXY02375.1 hypothetical protein DF185_06930 [Marinifilum breve]
MDLFTNTQCDNQKEKLNKSEPEVIVNVDYFKEQNKIFENTNNSNPFYDKNVLFSKKLKGNKYSEFQIIGNFGGWADDSELTIETDYYIISNTLMNEIKSNPLHPIIENLNNVLNVYSAAEKKKIRNYKYKNLQIISEESFLRFVENRCKEINDTVTLNLINKLK